MDATPGPGALATRALLAEPAVWPRFGLVGPEDCGSHRDMSYHELCASAWALEPFFTTCALVAPTHFEAFRAAGAEAEKTMYAATAGVNTHKGALFLLGLLLAAWGQLQRSTPTRRPTVSELLALARRWAEPHLRADLARSRCGPSATYGEWAWRRHGARGIRGLVLDGFLPLRLAWALCSADPGPTSLAYARLLFLAQAEDTNLLRRAGEPLAQEVRRGASRLLAAQTNTACLQAQTNTACLQAQTNTAWLQVAALDHELRARSWSAAAAGDLMAALIWLLEMRRHGWLH